MFSLPSRVHLFFATGCEKSHAREQQSQTGSQWLVRRQRHHLIRYYYLLMSYYLVPKKWSSCFRYSCSVISTVRGLPKRATAAFYSCALRRQRIATPNNHRLVIRCTNSTTGRGCPVDGSFWVGRGITIDNSFESTPDGSFSGFFTASSANHTVGNRAVVETVRPSPIFPAKLFVGSARFDSFSSVSNHIEKIQTQKL
jgi:hypothetical protein